MASSFGCRIRGGAHALGQPGHLVGHDLGEHLLAVAHLVVNRRMRHAGPLGQQSQAVADDAMLCPEHCGCLENAATAFPRHGALRGKPVRPRGATRLAVGGLRGVAQRLRFEVGPQRWFRCLRLDVGRGSLGGEGNLRCIAHVTIYNAFSNRMQRLMTASAGQSHLGAEMAEDDKARRRPSRAVYKTPIIYQPDL
jgi:hypothetical protein